MSKTLAQFIGEVELKAIRIHEIKDKVDYYLNIHNQSEIKGLTPSNRVRARNYILSRIVEIKKAWSRQPTDPFYYEDREPGN